MAKDIKITPIGRRILVVADKVEEKTAGGLVLPPETGKVVKLGEGSFKGKPVHFDVKVGDRVYFKKYSPDEVEIGGEKYLLLDQEDILAIIK